MHEATNSELISAAVARLAMRLPRALLPAEARRRLPVEAPAVLLGAGRLDDHAVAVAGAAGADEAVAHVLQDELGVAGEGVPVAAAAGAHRADGVAAGDLHVGELGGHGPLGGGARVEDHLAHAAGLAAEDAGGREAVAVALQAHPAGGQI